MDFSPIIIIASISAMSADNKQDAPAPLSDCPEINGAAEIGALLATLSLPAHFILPGTISHQFAAIVLTLVAGIYVGLVVYDGRSKAVATEGCVALLFAAAALVGLAYWHWTIVLAYVLHGFWDLAHHRSVDTAMPRWYIPFCALFDWIFAAGLFAAWAI